MSHLDYRAGGLLGLGPQMSVEIDFERKPEAIVRVTGVCPVMRKEHSVVVPLIGFLLWRHGSKIQDALPKVSPEDREFLVSGLSPDGWKQTFSGSEES